jgi:hypothetical protein
MIAEHNLIIPFSRSAGDAYKSSQAAELSLNAAILSAEIARSYQDFLDIFKTFYADDVEVSREGLRKMIRGKARIRPFLLNVLVPLRVMAEFAGLSVSVQQIGEPLTVDDLNLGSGRSWPVSIAPLRARGLLEEQTHRKSDSL